MFQRFETRCAPSTELGRLIVGSRHHTEGRANPFFSALRAYRQRKLGWLPLEQRTLVQVHVREMRPRLAAREDRFITGFLAET